MSGEETAVNNGVQEPSSQFQEPDKAQPDDGTVKEGDFETAPGPGEKMNDAVNNGVEESRESTVQKEEAAPSSNDLGSEIQDQNQQEG